MVAAVMVVTVMVVTMVVVMVMMVVMLFVVDFKMWSRAELQKRLFSQCEES